NKDDMEEMNEQDVETEEVCQEVEVTQEEKKGVAITLPKLLETSLSKLPSSILTFESVKFLSLS
ncbi:hypothetical protein, partial [Klebsiella pneumoniae]|uniref:hypothetical protein n=1 Tax=Klebsiella pneumoniae TaxID=573 RepID=UPI003013B906